MAEFAISHYRVLEMLGGGGMGVVYKAKDTRLGRFVALKFLQKELAGSDEFRERFRREARAASSLNHPHICTIYEVDEQDGQSFIAMELIEGRPLNEMVRQGPLSIDQTIEFAIQLADGLEFAHSRNIIHRDIKPANIYVTSRGQAKILDFGLAKQLKEELLSVDKNSNKESNPPANSLTSHHTIVGTISYIPPEQARGFAADARGDLFSFGAVIYEMATGERAFKGVTAAVVFDAILNHAPVPMRQLNAGVPPRLEEIVFKSLRKDIEGRYQHASEIQADLKLLQRDIQSGVASSSAVRVAIRQPSIVVLPFTDMSAEHDQEYLCEGIAEELINALAHLQGLRVISRTTAALLRKQELDVSAIGEKLKVSAVLEGSVRKAANGLRVTVKLVEVSSGYSLWSERYDREVADVFEIQDEIAQSVVTKLKIQLAVGSAPLVRRYTDNIEAYNLYLRGRFYWNKRYEIGVQKGMECFQQAIEKDSYYALAYTGLADSYSVLAVYNFLSPDAGYGRAKTAALKALELDDSLAEAHASVGFVRLFYDWDWQAAESSLRRAIQINPNDAVSRYWFATFLSVHKRFDESRESAKKALELEPLSSLVSAMVGWNLLLERRYDQAIAQLRCALEIESSLYVAQCFLAIAYAQASMFGQARELMEQAVKGTHGAKQMLQGLAMVHAIGGRVDDANTVMETLQQRTDSQYLSPFYNACVYALLGEADRAIGFLEKAFLERDGAIIYLKSFPLVDNLRGNARFQDLLHRMTFDADNQEV